MKNIIALTIIVSLISFACKKDTTAVRPTTINVTGTITDKLTGNPVDSVSVALEYSTGTIGSTYIPQTSMLTGTNGKYSFQFSVKSNYSYKVNFDKTNAGYQWTSSYVDLTKASQVINIVLAK